MNRSRRPFGFLAASSCMLAAMAVSVQAQEQADGAVSHRSDCALVYTEGMIGKGQRWATPWYAVDSKRTGPVVLVTGGVHGNEPAGWRAARQIRHWPIAAGRLVVVPHVNTLGLRADMRWIPEHRNDRTLRDLNRNFPTKDAPEARTQLAEALWKFIVQIKPDYVFDLHEGFAIHRENGKSVGSSVISFPQDENMVLARAMVAAVNATIPNEEQHFDLLARSGPVTGSLARAAAEQLGAMAFILETTFRDQPMSTRTRQHRCMMNAALVSIGVLPADANASDVLAPNKTASTNVAMFDGPGTGATGEAIARIIDGHDEAFLVRIGKHDIRPEILEQFDVVLFPGGSGSKQGRAIGPQGREHVRAFIRSGGGCIGICAGAYLCSSHYDWSLDVVNSRVYNTTIDIFGVGRKSMWYRGGAADVQVEFNATGADLLGFSGQHTVRYQNGPIMSPGDHDSLPAYRALAYFRSENYRYEAQKGTMTDTPAIVMSKYGDGTVFAVSPHFESTPEMEWLIWKIVQKAE